MDERSTVNNQGRERMMMMKGRGVNEEATRILGGFTRDGRLQGTDVGAIVSPNHT